MQDNDETQTKYTNSSNSLFVASLAKGMMILECFTKENCY